MHDPTPRRRVIHRSMPAWAAMLALLAGTAAGCAPRTAERARVMVDGVQQVEIAVSGRHLEPAIVLATPDRPLRIVYRNASSEEHSLRLTAADGTVLFQLDAVPGEEREHVVTLPPGVHRLSCGTGVHATLGETGEVRVR